MKSEELKRKIVIQKYENAVNDNGFEEEAWQNFKPVWAKVENLHGREYFEAAAVKAENTVKFTIRYVPSIEPTMRILFQGKQYNITSIDNIKYANKFIEIKGMEVDNSG